MTMMTLAEYDDHKHTHTKFNSYWAKDARGIELRRACDECEHLLAEQYAPEVLGLSGRYEDVVEEAIEPDDGYDGDSDDLADREFDAESREMFG